MKTSFTYLGKNSLDFGIRVEEGVTFDSPERDINFLEISGRDGDVGIDNQRLKSINKSFPVTIFPVQGKSFSQQMTDISNWLKTQIGNVFLDVSSEPKYSYYGFYYEQYSVEKFFKVYGRAVINFKIQPYKFLKSGLTPLTSPTALNNPTTRDARPLITIKGTGNITLQIGTEKLTLKNVDGGIVIDSLKQVVTNLDGTRPAWDKVTSYPLPVIKPGNQAVLTTGTITELKITPRYEVIV